MNDINSIKKEIYSSCLLVEEKIVGHDYEKAKQWATANAKRHSFVIREIVKLISCGNAPPLAILNASGLAGGHQDFSICKYFRGNGISLVWTALESPASPYLTNPTFKLQLEENEINLILVDFSLKPEINLSGKFDVILFTEIAEHLEHGTLLNTLSNLRALLNDKGVIIITTPNMAYIGNRFRLLVGNGDIGYWGDGKANLNEGLWGHIVYYDISRLQRLLKDIGYNTIYENSFNYTFSMKPMGIKLILLEILTKIIKHSSQTLILVASKCEHLEIPMKY